MSASQRYFALKHSDTAFWEQRERQLVAYQQNHAALYAEQVDVQNRMDSNYLTHLNILKSFFFPGDTEMLEIVEGFYDPLIYDFVNRDANFSRIIINLSDIKNAIPLESDDEEYSYCRDLLANLVVLLKAMCDVKIYNPKSHFIKGLDFKRQLAELATVTDDIKNVLSKPGDTDACDALMTSAVDLHQQMETYVGAFRRNLFERPLLHTAICAVGAVVGLALFIAGAFMQSLTFGVSAAVSTLGVAMIGASWGVYTVRANNQDDKHKRERDLAYISRTTSFAIGNFLDARASLFSPSREPTESYELSVEPVYLRR